MDDLKVDFRFDRCHVRCRRFPASFHLNFKLMTGSASVVLSYWLPVYIVVVSTPEYGDKNEWLGFGLNR
jgi:hypothetical protein